MLSAQASELIELKPMDHIEIQNQSRESLKLTDVQRINRLVKRCNISSIMFTGLLTSQPDTSMPLRDSTKALTPALSRFCAGWGIGQKTTEAEASSARVKARFRELRQKRFRVRQGILTQTIEWFLVQFHAAMPICER
jgi:hypothetical protein